MYRFLIFFYSSEETELCREIHTLEMPEHRQCYQIKRNESAGIIQPYITNECAQTTI